MDAVNDFSKLDAQDGVSRLAQMSPEEHAEAQAFFDELASQDWEAGR